MKKYLFVANSAYSLLLYTLKYVEQVKDTLFVLGSSVQHANLSDKLALNLPNEIAFRTQAIKLLKGQIEAFCPHIEKAYINVASVGDDVADVLAAQYPVTALSDGLSDFQKFPQYMAEKRFESYFRVGSAEDTAKLPQHPNLETDTLTHLWSDLSSGQQRAIASVFHVNQDDLDVLKQREVILVTQPLSEDGILSEEDKQQFYQDILSNYPANKVVIKPHPREVTPWSAVVPSAPVISNQVPMELLALMIPVSKIATFFSTAGTNLVSPEKVDFYSKGFEQLSFVHPEQPKMGHMPYVNIEELLRGKPFNWKRVPDKSGKWYAKRQTPQFQQSRDIGYTRD